VQTHAKTVCLVTLKLPKSPQILGSAERHRTCPMEDLKGPSHNTWEELEGWLAMSGGAAPQEQRCRGAKWHDWGHSRNLWQSMGWTPICRFLG